MLEVIEMFGVLGIGSLRYDTLLLRTGVEGATERLMEM